MGSRFASHQLSNGLYVSGLPEQPKDKSQTMSSVPMPYTGGDIKKSGEFGKMFDVHAEKSRKSGQLNSGPLKTGSFGGAASNNSGSQPSAAQVTGVSGRPKSNSGPLKHGEAGKKPSGPQSKPMSRQNSGPMTPVLPTTGLITSGPISSGPLNSSGAPRKISGPPDVTGSMKLHSSIVNNPAVTKLREEDISWSRGSLPKPILWSVILLFVLGFIAGGFILAAVHNPILLIVVVVIFGVVAALYIWNAFFGRKATIGYITRYADAELRSAKDGQYIKVSGVVTCGNFPLESSYSKVPRCVYTCTTLYEYRGWGSKAANPKHRRFSWGVRALESHAVDFYISDFQSGLRALVKTGYGVRVTPYVDESVVVDINSSNKDSSPEFLRWLQERNISSNDSAMRLKEGYIKEGSTVSVMGVVQRHDNVLMIVPPSEPLSTGCQWAKCIVPANLDGIVLRCEDTSKSDVIPV